MQLYKYAFYKLLTWARKQESDIDFVLLKAFLSLIVLVFINLLTIKLYVGTIFNIQIYDGSLGKLNTILVNIILAIPQYFILIYKKKYLKIETKFEPETDKQRIVGNVIMAFYIIGTFLSFIAWFYIEEALE